MGPDFCPYGIGISTGPDGVPLLVVWTHNPDGSARAFDGLKASVTGFLEREVGLCGHCRVGSGVELTALLACL